MLVKPWEKLRDQDDAGGSAEEMSAEELAKIEAEFEAGFNPGGESGDEPKPGDKPLETPPDPSQAFLKSLKDQGIGDFKDIEEATTAIARINTERAHYQSGNTKLNQVFSVLKGVPNFNEIMHAALQGAATGNPQAAAVPKSLENLPENQRAALQEVIDYRVQQQLGGFKQEVLNTVSGQSFVEARPDYAFLSSRIQEIANITGYNDDPLALEMAYERARNEAIASGQYPYQLDEQGNPVDAGGNGNLNRNFSPQFNQPINQPKFNGPPINNARRFTTVPTGGTNRGSSNPANIKAPETEAEHQTAWEALMKNYPGYQGGDGGQSY